MAALAVADLADGESLVIEGVLVSHSSRTARWPVTSSAGCWLVSPGTPIVDTVMMRWVIPHMGTVEVVRKSKARMEAVATEYREELQRQGRL